MDGAMKGKVCLVTGATAGIGEVTALELARQGATVVVVSRSPEKCAATVARIQQDTGNPNVEYIAADMASQASIRALADTFKQRHAALHVLVNNAGGIFQTRQETVDGFEMTFALNHLGYFTLTHLLIPQLKAAGKARVVSVSSAAQRVRYLNLDDPMFKSNYSAWKAYGQSKLANVLFTYELARRLQGTGVTATALHPGFVASSFGHQGSSLWQSVIKLSQLFAISKEAGAKTSIYLASSPEVEGVTGKYFYKCKQQQSVPESYDVALAARLWSVSAALTGLPEAI